jgi:hypothetical protein
MQPKQKDRKVQFQPRGAPLSTEERIELRELSEHVNEPALVEALGLSSVAYYRALAGLPLQTATRTHIATMLPSLKAMFAHR